MCFSGIAFPSCGCAQASGLLLESGVGGQVPSQGSGGREVEEAVLLEVTSGEGSASLHFAEDKMMLMRSGVLCAVWSVIHCCLKQLGQKFKDKSLLSK